MRRAPVAAHLPVALLITEILDEAEIPSCYRPWPVSPKDEPLEEHLEPAEEYQLPCSEADLVERMRNAWDAYARENPMFYINSLGRSLSESFHWDPDEFFATGRAVLEIVENLFPKRDWSDACLLEIGCGLGRESAFLSSVFGSVVALDISGEMVSAARGLHRHLKNLSFIQGTGHDLAPLEDRSFDCVYSNIVFQHILDVAIVADYLYESSRILRSGGVVVVQLFDLPEATAVAENVWTCTRLARSQLQRLLDVVGLRRIGGRGEGSEFCWVVAERTGADLPDQQRWKALRDSILGRSDRSRRP